MVVVEGQRGAGRTLAQRFVEKPVLVRQVVGADLQQFLHVGHQGRPVFGPAGIQRGHALQSAEHQRPQRLVDVAVGLQPQAGGHGIGVGVFGMGYGHQHVGLLRLRNGSAGSDPVRSEFFEPTAP